MPPLLMAGFDRVQLPTRTVREAARERSDGISPLVAAGRVHPWDLFRMLDCDIPGAAEWADEALNQLLAPAAEKAAGMLASGCTDCQDIGFYGLPHAEDPDILTTLLRRQGDGGYEQLTAAGTWKVWEPRYDQQLEILTHEIATDLAEAITAGASGLARRYFWPQAFLPPTTMIAAAPAKELSSPDAAVDSQDSLHPEQTTDQGWTTYAVVDDLDPGAVLDLIRLRRGPTGPELVAYQNGVWGDAPDLLSELQGVQPPPLVELDAGQEAAVIAQIDQGGPGNSDGSEDTGDAGEGLDEADKSRPHAPATPKPKPSGVPEDEKHLQGKEPVAAAGAPKCKFCDDQATKRIAHAEGSATIAACAKHVGMAKKAAGEGNEVSDIEDAISAAATKLDTASREKAAKKGQALPGGGFPIKNRDDLRKAVKALGRAKNQAAAKRHIIKRARALNALGDLPESWGITAAVSLVADAPLTVSPDPRAEKLRRYWTTGKGALKIRWGTPGDWKRCYRHLAKFMGLRAKGYCQNLHKRATGVWTGSRLNPGRRSGGRGHALAASGALSMEAVLVAAVSTGRWTAPEGVNGMLKDGIYIEGGGDTALLKTLTAGGFPVAPPDHWFENPQLDGPTPLTVEDDGRVYGHIATFDVAHIGLPGRVRAPRSRTDYAYFKTGELRTASGGSVNVGQITLAGGHAPLQADAAAAVAHYDNTASAVADVNCGEDRFGIWVAGGLRPEVTPAQLRTLRASAPSGDWRPINGHLELVACCQVNVPGFPTTRARVASGAITSLVAAGAAPLYARRITMMADAAVAERLEAIENVVFDSITEGPIPVTADGEPAGEGAGDGDPSVTEGTGDEGQPEEGEKPVSDAVKRARALAAERRAAREAAEAQDDPVAEPVAPDAPTDVVAEAAADDAQAEQAHELDVDAHRTAAEARMAELRKRVHGNRPVPVAAAAGN